MRRISGVFVIGHFITAVYGRESVCKTEYRAISHGRAVNNFFAYGAHFVRAASFVTERRHCSGHAIQPIIMAAIAPIAITLAKAPTDAAMMSRRSR